MKFIRSNISNQIFIFILFAVVAFLSYQKNFFDFSEDKFFKTFDKSSESLVVGNIVADQFGVERYGWNLGFIGFVDTPLDTALSYKILEEGSVSSPINFSAYGSQFGIQGIFFSRVNNFFGMLSVESLNALNALFMAVVVALLSTLYLKIYDKTFGIIFFITMVSSPWVVSFARNLYWVPFAWFLPAVFAALTYLSERRAAKFFFLTCVLFSVAVKSLAGYEYLTTITLFACSVFFLAPIFRGDKVQIISGIKLGSLIFIFCVLGFLSALLLHATMRGDSIFSGLYNIYQVDVKRRTYGDSSQFDPVFKASLDSSFFDVLNIYWTDWQTPLAMFIPGKYLEIFFFLCVIGFIYGGLIKRKFNYRECALLLIFFAVSASWFVFGKAHSYIHTQLNYVLWYFGFVQALLYCLVRFTVLICADIFNLGKKLGLIFSAVIGCVVFFLVLLGLARHVDNQMSTVTLGVIDPVNVGAGLKVFFRDDGKIVFYASSCRDLDLTGYFILHFIPENKDLSVASPYGFENRDFVWPASPNTMNWNPFSNHFGSCYTEVSMPNYKIVELRTGQYDLSDSGLISIRWDMYTKVPSFNGMLVEMSPYNLTDSNWENGISRVRPGFFIQNSVRNRMSFSVNDTIEFPFSDRRVISDIKYTDDYINVFLEGENLDPTQDGYPNKFSIKK